MYSHTILLQNLHASHYPTFLPNCCLGYVMFCCLKIRICALYVYLLFCTLKFVYPAWTEWSVYLDVPA